MILNKGEIDGQKDLSKQDILIDELLQNYRILEDVLGKTGLLKQLIKRLVERTLKAELTAHLGYKPHLIQGHGSGNSLNKGVAR